MTTGYLDERGYLFVVDHLKDMIVSGGENVCSVEVVDALPTSAAGKVLKRELRAKYWTGSDRSVG